jgi:hypothetical protein
MSCGGSGARTCESRHGRNGWASVRALLNLKVQARARSEFFKGTRTVRVVHSFADFVHSVACRDRSRRRGRRCMLSRCLHMFLQSRWRVALDVPWPWRKSVCRSPCSLCRQSRYDCMRGRRGELGRYSSLQPRPLIRRATPRVLERAYRGLRRCGAQRECMARG